MGSRSTIDIVSHVLEAANGGASKMQIMYGALLSCKQMMKEYVNFLSEKGPACLWLLTTRRSADIQDY